MTDIKVTLFDGSYHDVDSSEMAFKLCAMQAIRESTRKAGVQLLEPIMKVDVSVPEEYVGDVMGNLSSKRGIIQGQETRGITTVVTALVPLSELFGYTTELRSMTKGRGTPSIEQSHYGIVPKNIADTILNK